MSNPMLATQRASRFPRQSPFTAKHEIGVAFFAAADPGSGVGNGGGGIIAAAAASAGATNEPVRIEKWRTWPAESPTSRCGERRKD